MQALLDLDVIVYRIGFACEKKEEDGSITVDPLDHCLHSLKQYMHSIMDGCGATDYRGFLTGKDNFRMKVDPLYKCSRKDSRKPHYYKDIREFMMYSYAAELIDGMEADDALALNQTDDTIICTIDKDLLMVAGNHYNFVKKEHKYITPEEGRRRFYAQMLSGDNADDIPGIRGVGEKTANKLLSANTHWDVLLAEKYQEFFGEGWKLRMQQNALLLWMRQRDVYIPIKWNHI